MKDGIERGPVVMGNVTKSELLLPGIDAQKRYASGVGIGIENRVLTASTMMVSCPLGHLKKKATLLDTDDWIAIRWLHKREEKSIRAISRDFGRSRKTVRKYVRDPDPPRYTLSRPRQRPVSDQWRAKVKEILDSDKEAPRKQRHTAKRIFDRLVSEQGYEGSERTIRNVVAEIKNKPATKASIPLLFQAGKDAQVDFGESYAYLGGPLVKLQGFEMRMCYSRKKFLQYFPSTDKEAFLEGHVKAFEYYGGVCERLSYDNASAIVAGVGKGKSRTLTKEFKELKGYYNFEANFCQPGIEGAHEKGGIESSVGFSRRNWMVPPPRFESLEELNKYLVQKCLEDEDRTVDGQDQTIGEAWKMEKPMLLPLPAKPFDPVVKSGGLVDSYCTVPLKETHYSVPANYVGKALVIRSYWNRVEISNGMEIVAEHPRSYKKGEYVLRPEHYLDLLERRPNAVPYARPLLQYEWPAGYWELYQKMVEDIGPSKGGRDFIRILKSHVKYGSKIVAGAIAEAHKLGVANADFIMSLIDKVRITLSAPEATDLSNHQELAAVKVSMYPAPAQYNVLFSEGGVSNGERIACGISEAAAPIDDSQVMRAASGGSRVEQSKLSGLPVLSLRTRGTGTG